MYPTCFSAYLQQDTSPHATFHPLCCTLLYCNALMKEVKSMDPSLLGWYQISSLLVPELHLVAQHIDV